VRSTPFLLCLTLAVGGLSACGDDDKESGPRPSVSPGAACSEANAPTVSRAFVGPKGFAPACVKTARNTEFVIGNVDAKGHSVKTEKGSPQAFTADLPKKNSLFSVKLAKPGTYHVSASGGASLTIFVR
jgi:hypothetical protein